jgi:hypothetical protein
MKGNWTDSRSSVLRITQRSAPARRAKGFQPHYFRIGLCVYAQPGHWKRSQFSDATIFSDPHPGRFVLPYAPMPPVEKPRLLKQRRLLHEATDLFGRKAIAEGLKISKATLDGWMKGRSEMPDTMLIALAHLLVRLAGKDRT